MTVGPPNISCIYDSPFMPEFHLNQRSHKTFIDVKDSCEFSTQKADSPLFRLIEVGVSLDEKHTSSVGHDPQRFLFSKSLLVHRNLLLRLW